MAIDMSGQDQMPEEGSITIKVTKNHPLVQLALALPWAMLMQIVLPDLKGSTKKGFWWMGRKIKVRIHLAAYLLQRLYNLTDRKIEYEMRDNAAFQLFCGLGIVNGWHVPDHTKIEEFRSRLSSETQRILVIEVSKAAVFLGFADPSKVDFDSTVQEAGITYPSDAALMTKLAGLGKKFADYLRKTLPNLIPSGQLGRIGGNFMIVLKSTTVMMNDKKSFIPLLEEHQAIFGEGALNSVATDKGYWTLKNKQALTDLGVTTAGFQKPGKSQEEKTDLDLKEHLHNRRGGIEPLIGHIKRGGQLGKSRMKSDAATLAAGYGSVLGFNLRQMIRCQQGKMKLVA